MNKRMATLYKGLINGMLKTEPFRSRDNKYFFWIDHYVNWNDDRPLCSYYVTFSPEGITVEVDEIEK